MIITEWKPTFQTFLSAHRDTESTVKLVDFRSRRQCMFCRAETVTQVSPSGKSNEIRINIEKLYLKYFKTSPHSDFCHFISKFDNSGRKSFWLQLIFILIFEPKSTGRFE